MKPKKMEIKHESIELKLSEFKSKNEPKGLRLSKLDPHKELIANLHQDNYSLEQICDFLKVINITVHYTTISRFIKRRGIVKKYLENTVVLDKKSSPKMSYDEKGIENKNSGNGLHIERPKHQKFEYSPAVLPGPSKGENNE